MANYFVINRPSNLVEGVMASRYTPTETKIVKFVKANDKSLDKYYKLLKARPEMLPDIGELMSMSPFVYDEVCGDSKGDAKPQKISYRPEREEPYTEREKYIVAWIKQNPSCDEYDVDDKYNTGSLAAKTYIDRCK